MSYDAQFFTQCDHVVNNIFYGSKTIATPTRIITEGTTLYNFNGEWTENLPISNNMELYVPIMNIPSGSTQYYYNDNWNNFLPKETVTNGATYNFILANDATANTYSYYYYNDKVGDFTWNAQLPNNPGTTYIPVLPRSEAITQYYYGGIWSSAYPNISNTTIYVMSKEVNNNVTEYYYNNEYTTIPPQSLSTPIPTRVSPLGSQQYYYNGQWVSALPPNVIGEIYVYAQNLSGSSSQYFYNGGWNAQEPTGFEVINTRTLLTQSLLYLYDGTLQNSPPSTIYSPYLIFARSTNGVMEYNYNNTWNPDVPNKDEVFLIKNDNYLVPNTSNIVTAYYYNNAWNQDEPQILVPDVSVDITVQKNGTLLFYYNGNSNVLPPTELLTVQSRVLSAPENQYFYNNIWNSSPPTNTSASINYISTKVVPQDVTQYYYNNAWNNASLEIFEADLCPRCYGKGYYIDISFDNSGDSILATNTLKLEQEILKILITNQGDNIFYPQYGTNIENKLIGHKNLGYTKTRLNFLITQALQYLQQAQINEQGRWDNMTQFELIQTIDYVQVIPTSKTSYQITVQITTQSDGTVVHRFTL